jgi:hypothetical protein
MITSRGDEKQCENNGAAHARVVAIESKRDIVGVTGVQHFDIERQKYQRRIADRDTKREINKERNKERR